MSLFDPAKLSVGRAGVIGLRARLRWVDLEVDVRVMATLTELFAESHPWK